MNPKRYVFILTWLLLLAHGAIVNAQPGSLLWKVKTSGKITSPPVIANGDKIFIVSHDKHLYAIGLGGNIRWAFETGF